MSGWSQYLGWFFGVYLLEKHGFCIILHPSAISGDKLADFIYMYIYIFSAPGGLNKTMKMALYIGAPILGVLLLLPILCALCFCR